MQEDVITIKELAKALKVTEQHLYRELKQPGCKIPVNEIGGAKRFLLSEVLKATCNDRFILYKNAFEAAKDFIDSHLADPDLSIDMILNHKKYIDAVELLKL